MAEPLLRVQNLCAGYGQVQVLWGADVTVERGSIACLLHAPEFHETGDHHAIGNVKAGIGLDRSQARWAAIPRTRRRP